MRLNYVDADPKMSSPDDQAVVDGIKARRNGTLLPLDRALLHAPPIAGGYSAFLKAVRTQNSLPDSIRELCMCRVASLNRAWFEWESHAPLLLKAGVVDQGAVDKLRDTTDRDEGKNGKTIEEWVEAGLDEKHAAVVMYTDAMTRDIVVRDPVFQKVKELFSEREVVEITTTIAAYNAVSRFLVALDVSEMASKYGIDMS